MVMNPIPIDIRIPQKRCFRYAKKGSSHTSQTQGVWKPRTMVESIKNHQVNKFKDLGTSSSSPPKKPTEEFGVWMHDFGTSPNPSELWMSKKGEDEITLLRVIPTMTCWVEVVR